MGKNVPDSSCSAGGSFTRLRHSRSAWPCRRIPVLAWPRASPSRGARLPRSPFRSPKSSETFEEVYAGEALPPSPSACPGCRIPVPAWPRASPSRRARLPRSPFRSPKSPATFEEVYAGEALPPSPPVRGARGGVPPLEGVPRGLACLGSGCPGPVVAAARCLLRGLAPPALQEESSQQIIKNYFYTLYF